MIGRKKEDEAADSTADAKGDRPRARPCAPSACARPSSSRSAHPRPPDSSTPCWTCASCACDPVAPGLRESGLRCPRPSLIRGKNMESQIEYLLPPSLSSEWLSRKGCAAAMSQFADFFRLRGLSHRCGEVSKEIQGGNYGREFPCDQRLN